MECGALVHGCPGHLAAIMTCFGEVWSLCGVHLELYKMELPEESLLSWLESPEGDSVTRRAGGAGCREVLSWVNLLPSSASKPHLCLQLPRKALHLTTGGLHLDTRFLHFFFYIHLSCPLRKDMNLSSFSCGGVLK